ncbi:MAG: glycine zipper 2TM domain-containing protein [Betaproteobacteria bacterium]|nr:glycine zipper 2TM domain-containing protein [Betaproteobacteria bacterium]
MKLSKAITIIFASAAIFAAGAVHAACDNCGVVSELKTAKQKGEGSGVGVVAGAVLGGVLGHQVGSGRGKDLATVAGAAGGAYAGNAAEKKLMEKTVYQVIVKMEGGNSRTFTFGAESAFKVGDKVKVVDGKLTRD